MRDSITRQLQAYSKLALFHRKIGLFLCRRVSCILDSAWRVLRWHALEDGTQSHTARDSGGSGQQGSIR